MTMAERNDLMTDADLMDAIQALDEHEKSDEMKELLKMMNDNRIISWEEAEQIMICSNHNGPIKSSLPPQTRPMEPDNDTNVDWSIEQLQMNNPKLKQINLNNMKRTPIPQVKRLLSAIKNNTHLEKITLANMGLYDNDCEPIFEMVTYNTTLKSINLETNYLSGNFFARLFKAALVNQTLEEVKAVNQGVTFATAAEKEIIDAVFQNRGLTKVSINLRLPEGRHKIENALIRNQEIRRILRRQAAAAVREVEEMQKRSEEVNKSVAAEAKMQFRTPQQLKPTALKNTSQVVPASHIVSDSKPTSTSATSNSGKIPPAVIGSDVKTSPNIVGSNEKTISTFLGEKKTVDEHNKVADVVNRTIINNILIESFQRNDPMKITTSKKTELMSASTKAKVTDTTEEEISGKVKSKMMLRKRVSLEQAVPEMELDTDEVLRKTSVSKKSSLAAVKESCAPFRTNETVIPKSTDSVFSKSQSNACNSSIKNNFEVSAKETDSVIPVRKNGTRSSSIIPPIFLASEQKNGPLKRNFSIPSKKNSSELEKIAAKLDELQKSSLHSIPFNSPKLVHTLKRENNL